jgi:hypothetical protein
VSSMSSQVFILPLSFTQPWFTIAGGEWDEDDFISLHALSPESPFPSEANQIAFEYTAPPELSGNRRLRGVVLIPLPFYGGPFCLRYQRVSITVVPAAQQLTPTQESSLDDPEFEDRPVAPPQTALVLRESLPLASCAPFCVTFQIQLRSQLCRARNGRGFTASEPGKPKAPAGSLLCLVEDLQNIQALVLTVVFGNSNSSASRSLTKPASWLAKSNNPSGLSLVLECDVSEPDSDSQPDWISIPLPSLDFEFLWSDAHGVVEADKIADSAPFGNRIVIKIPYASRAPPSPSLGSSAPRPPFGFSGLVCRSCGAELLSSGAIERVLPLPSGLFDQVMHEFLCSETQPTMPLSMADFTTPRGSISVGEIFLSVHPPDLSLGGAAVGPATGADRLQLLCKMAPSLLDVIGGSLVKRLPQFGLAEHSSTLSLVDASTCSVQCSRCHSVLGDGLIASDLLDSHDHSSQASPLLAEAIHLTDLQDLRFLRSEVRWQSCGLEGTWGGADLISLLTEPCTAEQVVSNTFLWLVNRYDVTSFELCVADWTDHSARTTLRLRLLSRSQREGHDQQVSRLRSGYSAAAAPAPLRRAVKLSYLLCPHGEVRSKSSKPISIPVSFSDYCEVIFSLPLSSFYLFLSQILDALESRATFLGPSFLPGERFSFLFQ